MTFPYKLIDLTHALDSAIPTWNGGCGLYAGADGGYGAAQRPYVKRGYIPDGKGVTYNYESIIPGNSYLLDDDLVLGFTKRLR